MNPSIADPSALIQIDEYHEHLVEVGRSRHTIKAYTRDLVNFAEFTRLPLWPAPANLEGLIQRWLASRRRLGDAVVSLRRRIFAVKSYYHYAGIPQLLESIVVPKTQWYMPKVMSTPEVERLMAELSQTDPEAFSLYRLILLSGFKFEEIYRLQLTEEDLKARRVRVVDDRDQTREVVIGEVSAFILDSYLATGGKWKQSKSRFAKALQVAGAIAGIKNATSHILRATCAARLLAAGHPKVFVKANMGYASQTTIDMIAKVSKRDLVDDFHF